MQNEMFTVGSREEASAKFMYKSNLRTYKEEH